MFWVRLARKNEIHRAINAPILKNIFIPLKGHIVVVILNRPPCLLVSRYHVSVDRECKVSEGQRAKARNSLTISASAIFQAFLSGMVVIPPLTRHRLCLGE